MASIEPQRQQHPGGTWSLLSLVDELLLSIIDQIDSHSALCSLTATCTRFQGLVEPYCWRSILVTDGQHASRVALALNGRVERIAFVRDLAIQYNDVNEEGIENLGGVLANMGRLRNLTIESPCPNNSDWRMGAPFFSWTRVDYTTLFETGALPLLQSFTLHGHPSESRKFSFGRTAIIFFHPALRNITLSCCNFNADVTLDSIAPEKLKSTPLQSLTLIECNVYVRFLDVVLSLPRALTELSIGERRHIFDEYPSHEIIDRTSHPLFLSALQKQAGSLELLYHNGGHPSFLGPRRLTHESCSTALRSLERIRDLELGFESPLIGYLERDGCPPSLERLKLSDHALVPSPRPNHVPAVLRGAFDTVTKRVHKPINLDLLFNYNPHINLRALWFHPAHHANRKYVYDLAKAIKSRGKRLRVFSEKFEKGKPFIQPYMYGEDKPVEELLYDSEDFWTLCGTSHQGYDEELLEKPDLVDEFVRLRGGREGTGAEASGEILQPLAALHGVYNA